jgi:cobalt-precorrin 5A hydrolase/precorrin-3B C17-methyltransferase
VVLALSASGAPVARRVATALGAPLHGRAGRVAEADAFFDNALDHARDLFAAGVPVVGVCASGILIRAVAPLLSDKRAEPPVVSVSDDGAVVVPLLGGHRGANRLARRIATALEAVAAVTTAGDVALGVALDAPPPGWTLANPEAAKPAMAALLSGGGARVTGEAAGTASWLADLPQGDAVEICCTTAPADVLAPGKLVYHPRQAVLGLGASRGCPPEELAALAALVLEAAGIAPGALAAVASADIKADEPAVLALAAQLGAPLRLFTAAELEVETPRSQSPSDVVFAEIGTHGVAENAALAAAGPDAGLAVAKRKSAMGTAALTLAPAPIVRPGGRPRGRLSVVGIGPGQAGWRTPEVSRLIAEAEELVGYGLYIDLLGPLAAGKSRVDFPLGGEEARCRYALERAGAGANVALVCSGDAGIYAMAALVYELIDRGEGPGGVSDAARRAEVLVSPGVTALQAAAARVGAPIGHDFCAVSLSDLLTPREAILRRLKAAAEGDFVIAFYNPVSQRRRVLLAEARRILLAHRPADTPVVLARSLGRPDESLAHRTLETLEVDEVDMMTVVLIGASTSRRVDTGDGARVYTPRGYASKLEARDA